MDDTPTPSRPDSHKTWPMPDPMLAGDDMPLPAGMVMLEMVGYEVQPFDAAPPNTPKLSSMQMPAGHMNQYDIMFSFGNAMSGAPICNGMRKLPNPPVRN